MTDAYDALTRACPIVAQLTHGADEDTAAILREDLNWAFNLVSDQGDAVVSTAHTHDRGATSKPIDVQRSSSGTKLTIRRTPDDRSTYLIGPRMPRTTLGIEPGREPPASKTMTLIRVLEHRMDAILDGRIVEDDTGYRRRLAGLEAFIRRSGRMTDDRLVQVWLDTPWTTVRAPWMGDDGRWRASLLTPAETKAWSGPAVLHARIEGQDRMPSMHIGPMGWNVTGCLVPHDLIQDMRAISDLPPVRRRTGTA